MGRRSVQATIAGPVSGPNRATRLIALAAGGAVLVGIGMLSAGCSSSSKETPTTTTSSKPAAPSPTEKGVLPPPPQAFNPNMNAADGKSALEREGYSVQLNAGSGYSADRPLSNCTITGVDGLRGDHPPANTTVYLTVSCPNSNN